MRTRKFFLALCFVLLGLSFAQAQQSQPVEVRSFINTENFSCYVHVIKSSGGNILIDPGYYGQDLRDYVKSIGGIDTILLTHCHVDHIIGLNALKKDYPDAKIYIHALDREGLYDTHMNFSFERRISEPFIIDFDALPLEAGNYNFSGLNVKVIHAPGHSQGNALYYFPDEGLLFVGDMIASGGLPAHSYDNCNAAELFEDFTRMEKITLPEDTRIFFGHGAPMKFYDMMKTFDCFRKPLTLDVKTQDGGNFRAERFLL